MTKRCISIVMAVIIAFSSMASLVPASAATTEGAISSVVNKASGIGIKWHKSPNRSGYYVYRKVGSSSWSKVKTIKSISTVSWTDKNVTNGKKYTYKVCAYKGTKKYTNSITRTIYRLKRPSIKSISSPGEGKLKVVSYKNSCATGYQIKYSRNSSFSKSNKISVSGTKLSKTITELTSGKIYYVKIRAYKKVNGKKYYSSYSKAKNCTTKNATIHDYRQEVIDQAMYYTTQKTEYVHHESTGKDEDGNGKIGFDCSGFVSCVLNQVMQKYVKCYRMTANLQQLHDTEIAYNNGYESQFTATTVCKGTIDWDKLCPGDVLFFNSPGGKKNPYPYNHCALYLGNKRMIHSTSSAGGVAVRDVDGFYITSFESARRYIPTVQVKPLNITMTATRDVKLYPTLQCKSGTNKYVVSRGTDLIIKSTTKYGRYYTAYAVTKDGRYGYIYEYTDGKVM